jgi:hypothetical protein
VRWLTRVALAVSVCGLPCRAAAQLFTSLDANAARATYDGYLASGVFTLAPAATYADHGVRLGLDGAFSEFETGHTSAMVDATAGVGGPIASHIRWDLGGEGTELWYRSTPPVLSGIISPRLRFDQGPFGAWVAGAVGSTDNDSVFGQFVGRGEAGAVVALPHVTPSVTLSTTRAGVAHYTDFQGAVQSEYGRFGISATAGTRSGALLGGVASWFNAEARVTVFDGVALVIAGGSYPADLVRGAPGAHFIGGGLRVSDAFQLRKRPPAAARYGSLDGVSDVLVDARTLRFVAPANASVEIMADFTGWRPVPMVEVQPGVYHVTLDEPLSSGPHRVNIRVNHGDWGVPRELPPVTDDFGGTAGSLVVP